MRTRFARVSGVDSAGEKGPLTDLGRGVRVAALEGVCGEDVANAGDGAQVVVGEVAEVRYMKAARSSV